MWFLVVLGVLATVAPPARADNSEVLVRLLSEGGSFRVRARAAMALGRHAKASNQETRALELALRDRHAAVRAAAATALGNVGDGGAERALRSASRDPVAIVAKRAKLALRSIRRRHDIPARGPDPAAMSRDRSASARSPAAALRGARYAVVIGDMRDDSGFAASDLSRVLSSGIARELGRLRRVAVLTQPQVTDSLQRSLSQRRIPMFRVEGALRTVEVVSAGSQRAVRAEVSVLLLDEPGRNLRSMMRGAATGSGGHRGPANLRELSLAYKAVANAVKSAMSNARVAIKAAASARDNSASNGVVEGPAKAELQPRFRRDRARP